MLCDQQNCDLDSYEGRYTIDLPQGAMFDEEVPKQCFAGFVGDSTEAIRQISPFCARVSQGGFYAPTGSTAPMACDAGHFSLPASKSASDCLKCRAGTYADSEGTENCHPCAPGSFQPIEGQTTCESCTRGSVCAEGATVPLPCAEGSYGGAEGLRAQAECTTCPAGAACPTGATLPIECNAGTVAAEGGAARCAKCPAGSFQAAGGKTDCVSCTTGSFCPAGASASLPCPAGSYSAATELSSASQCTACPAGSFCSTGAQEHTPCAPGTFSVDEGAASCSPCARGSYQPSSNARSCLVCPVASFCPLPGSTVPTPCPGGTHSNYTGLREASECTPVGAGFYASTGSQFPEACPASGFVCPGAANDEVNAVPGSKPIEVDAGTATRVVTQTENMTQLTFELDVAQALTEGGAHTLESMETSIASLYGVPVEDVHLESVSRSSADASSEAALSVRIDTGELAADELAATVDSTDELALSSALGVPASLGSGAAQVEVTSVEVTVEEVTTCSPGHWCSAGNSIPCSLNTYNPNPGQIDMSACLPCPENAFGPEASISITACTCEAGFYDAQMADELVVCQQCPVGSLCHSTGMTLETLPIDKGYWRVNASSVDLSRCPDASSNDTACLGNQCKPWTTGPYCQQCNETTDRYYDHSTHACELCADADLGTSMGVLAAILVAALLLLAAVYVFRTAASAMYYRARNFVKYFSLRSKVKQLVALYQITSRISAVFSVPLPKSVATMLSALDVVSLDFDSFGIPIGCLQLYSFKNQLLFVISWPLVLCGAVLLGFVAFHLPATSLRAPRAVDRLQVGMLAAVPVILLVMFLAFPMVSSLAFRAFSCEEFDFGARYLRADYSLDCNDEDAYRPVRRVAWTAIVLYPVAMPAVILLMLYAARNAIRTGQKTALSRALNFLHEDLEARCYWWEVAEIAKKLFLVGFAALILPGSAEQLIMGFGFSLLFLLFSAIADPYTDPADHFFASVCNFILVAFFFLCLVLKFEVLAEAVDPMLTDSMRDQYTLRYPEIVTATMFVAIISASVLALLYAVYQLRMAVQAPIIKLVGTNGLPSLSLHRKHLWHLFLSHIWSTGQDQCATIKRQLCLLLPAVSIFLDVDDLESIDALEEYVRKSQVMMLFCSKGYFQSTNCLREVRATMETNKKFCLVHDPTKGGAPLEVVKEECPEEMRGPIFEGHSIITWHRIKDFQMTGLKLLAEELLLGCPEYSKRSSLPLYVPGELTSQRWVCRPTITVYVSDSNRGAANAMVLVRSELALSLHRLQKQRSSMTASHNFHDLDHAGVELQKALQSVIAHSAPTSSRKPSVKPKASLELTVIVEGSDQKLNHSLPTAKVNQSLATVGLYLTSEAPLALSYVPQAHWGLGRGRSFWRGSASSGTAGSRRSSSGLPSPAGRRASFAARWSHSSSALHGNVTKEALHGNVSAFVLYLNEDTFVGPRGLELAQEVRCARANKMPIIMLHENDPEQGGCAFDKFFVSTPQDLIQEGIFKQLALALQPPPFRSASAALVARALGAVDLGTRTSTIVSNITVTSLKRSLSSSSTHLKSDHLGPTSLDAFKADKPKAVGSEAVESRSPDGQDESTPARSKLVASSVTITTSDDDSDDDSSPVLQVSAARSTLRAAAVTMTTDDDGSGLSPILNVSTRVTGKDVKLKMTPLGFGMGFGADHVIIDVRPDSQAARSGEIQVGDRLISVNGKQLSSTFDIQAALKDVAHGTLVTLCLRTPPKDGTSNAMAATRVAATSDDNLRI